MVFTFFFSLIVVTFMPDSIAGFQLFETHRVPNSFTKREIPPSHKHTLNLKIGLKSDGIEVIKKRLVDVSNPNSPQYGKYLTSREVKDLSSPSRSTLDAVTGWLLAHGFNESSLNWSHNEDWVTLEKVPVKQVEEMLNTTYHYYQHDDGETLIRTESYSLPEDLHRHIELIQPTTMFGRIQPKSSIVRSASKPHNPRIKRFEIIQRKRGAEANQSEKKPKLPPFFNSCNDPFSVSNSCLRELYRTSSYKLKSRGQVNKIGVTAYAGERAFYDDLEDFLQKEGLPSNYNFTAVSVNGGTNPQTNTPEEMAMHAGGEGNLDIQTTIGFTAPMPNIFYTISGTPPFNPDLFTPTNSNEPYLEWLEYMASRPDKEIPQVISNSYGDDEQTVPINYARRVCNQFAVLGARGVSLIFSSGDDGVGKEGTCLSNDGRNATQFIPIFPATCPYVTAVGATQNFNPEVAVSVDGPGGFTSGGGFSNYFTMPKYQSQHVGRYLSNFRSDYDKLYNRNGRGVPDVSAQGAKYLITWQTRRVRVSGTSAAAPTFASVIALLNDYRLANSLPPLGFLNPWIHGEGYKALTDITVGNSAGCGTPGFPTAKGWDPVTGLGTPNFEAMQGLMKARRSQQKASR